MLGWPVSCPDPSSGPNRSLPDACLRSKSVKVYEGANIRNVALIGHGHAGKTSLVSAMLYTANATQRQGRVDDGRAVTDYDDEGIAREILITTGVAHAEWETPNI